VRPRRLEAEVRELQHDFQATLDSMQAGLSRLLQQRTGPQQRASQELPRASAVLLAAPRRAAPLSEQQALEVLQQAAETRATPAATAVMQLDPLLQQALLDFKLPLDRLLELQSGGLPLEGGGCEETLAPGSMDRTQALLAAGGPGPVAESTQAVEQPGAAASSSELAQEAGSSPTPQLASSMAHQASKGGEPALRSRSQGASGPGRSTGTLRSTSATSSGWDSIGGSSSLSSDAGGDSDYLEDEMEGSNYEGEEKGQGARACKPQRAHSHRQQHRADAPWPMRAKQWLLVRRHAGATCRCLVHGLTPCLLA
jgi:hypothetical protein